MTEFPGDRPVLVTCGLPYANGAAHIGHLRTYIPADMFVRTLRMMGQDTTFVCGSDTHGTPIVVNAEEQGITPGELVRKYHLVFEQTFKNFEIDFNHYGSTTISRTTSAPGRLSATWRRTGTCTRRRSRSPTAAIASAASPTATSRARARTAAPSPGATSAISAARNI